MSFKLTTTALATFMMLAPQAAFAKDYIDKVGLTSEGIDLAPIQVVAGGSKYKSVKPQNHKFFLRIYGRAKSGTKHLVEDYIDEIVHTLEHLAEESSGDISTEDKLEFFRRASQ